MGKTVTSGHITAFIWIGCILLLLAFIVTSGNGSATPTDTYFSVTIVAVGDGRVYVEDASGKEIKVTFPSLLQKIKDGELGIGDEIRLKRK